MGTALNKILKDLIVKFHQMMGRRFSLCTRLGLSWIAIKWKIEEISI